MRWIKVLDAASSAGASSLVCSLPPEDIPVTFQLGLIARDGIVLASDTLYVQNIDGQRSTYHSEKIGLGADALVAYCCAGDELAVRAAHFLSARRFAPQDDFRGRMMGAIQEARNENVGADFRGGHILAVHRTNDGPELWFTAISNGQVVRRVNHGKIVAGDTGNAAVFFAERYFPNASIPTVEELLPLAAHSVLMAGELNPGGVDGLEIAIIRSTGAEKLHGAGLSSLIEQSRRLDQQIAKELQGQPNKE
jgi:20S proteasome alpha/beta subunit